MDESVTFRPTAPRLMDQVRETLRFYHYAYNTKKSYVEWILKFICFSGKKHPRDMGKFEGVSASTQNQAFNAIVFLYKQVLNMGFDLNIRASRARKTKKMCRILLIS